MVKWRMRTFHSQKREAGVVKQRRPSRCSPFSGNPEMKAAHATHRSFGLTIAFHSFWIAISYIFCIPPSAFRRNLSIHNMPSSSSTVLVGSALVLAAAAAAVQFTSTSRSTELTEIDEDESDFITADEVVKVFDRLFLEMQSVLAQLSQQIQQIQMSGQQIPEKQLRMLLRGEFERALGVKQKVILEEFDMDEDCLEEATWEFLEKDEEYPKVRKAVERFQKLWENVSGENVVGKRPGQEGESKEIEPTELLDAQMTVEAAEVYFEALTNAMGELVKGMKSQGKNLREPAFAQELQMQFASVANEKGEAALEAMGITQAQFQKSIEANASNQMVGRSLAMLQMKQQQTLMGMGVPAS